MGQDDDTNRTGLPGGSPDDPARRPPDTHGQPDQNGHGIERREAFPLPHDHIPHDHDDATDELERQARETIRVIRETAGDLGIRVRQALDHATTLWEEARPGQLAESAVAPEHERLARALARRWTERDFLVDPDLPDAMSVTHVEQAQLWRVEVRERGETRWLGEGRESYTGQRRDALPAPVLPVWDYAYPLVPEIEAGERRERLPGTELIAACRICNGTGHRPCAACEGKGFVQCPLCHGRARVPCRTCRGRARIPDPVAGRRARSGVGYLQVQAERHARDAGERLADFAEKLRQDYGVPLPPSAQWAPGAQPLSGQTIPCPDCLDGTVPCECGNGKRICETCHGSGSSACPACAGSGRVVQYRTLVRRFDTRLTERSLPLEDAHALAWTTPQMLRKGAGELAWEGNLVSLNAAPPTGIPAAIWEATIAFARGAAERLDAGVDSQQSQQAALGERHVLSRRVRLTRVPLTKVDHTYAGKPFTFVAVGTGGAERFWAQAFPPRWSRVGRFLKALTRDLSGEPPASPSVRVREVGALSRLDDYRALREKRLEGPTASEAANGARSRPEGPENPGDVKNSADAADAPPAGEGE